MVCTYPFETLEALFYHLYNQIPFPCNVSKTITRHGEYIHPRIPDRFIGVDISVSERISIQAIVGLLVLVVPENRFFGIAITIKMGIDKAVGDPVPVICPRDHTCELCFEEEVKRFVGIPIQEGNVPRVPQWLAIFIPAVVFSRLLGSSQGEEWEMYRDLERRKPFCLAR